MNYQRQGSYRRSYIQQPKRHKRRWAKAIMLVALSVVIVGSFLFFGKNESILPNVIKSEPKKVRIEGRYLFAGTVVWARNMQEWSKNADGTTNYAYPFSGLNTFEREKYDAWLADLECPVLEQEVPISRQSSEVVFNCRPEFLPEAAKYFNFFNLANNHTHDIKGQAALAETRQHLEENKIQYFGDFEPGKTDNICEVVAMPVRIISELDGVESSKKANLPVALCAWHYFFRLPLDNEVETMKKYAEVMPVFAFIQAGVEYRPKADSTQEFMTRKIMDQGSEFVVENSAHWVQNGEVYKGKPILFSTGNFIFDQQSNSEVMRSASLDANMSLPYNESLEKLLAIGESCRAFKDDCFDQLQNLGQEKPKPAMTYELVAGDNSNKLTKRAGSDIQSAVEQRVGWPAIKAAINKNSN